MELTPSHVAQVSGLQVRRALPRAGRRTVGAWCFVDHMGPAQMKIGAGVDVAPHPHIGLQTVTWLYEGEALHRDSIGSEQLIRPGQLNLMTAGRGIAHSEESMGSSTGAVHGVQFWVAQPESTRDGAPAFEHHADLPQIELPHGLATVLIGSFAGSTSPARRDTEHIGVDLSVRTGRIEVPVEATHEHAIVVTSGTVVVDREQVAPGNLAYLGSGRTEIVIDATEPARLVLFGGIPFEEKVSMFWNFVARSHAEIDAAVDDWQGGSERFGEIRSRLERIPSPRPPWRAA